jgi:hypothetical protein
MRSRMDARIPTAEKRLFLMRCFVALRQWELQTPDLAGRMCGDCKSPQTWGGEGFGIRSGCLRVWAYEDAKAELFLREFRWLPYCAVAPEECVCYRHTILCWNVWRLCCTPNCVRFRFIIRFIVALPVEPWLMCATMWKSVLYLKNWGYKPQFCSYCMNVWRLQIPTSKKDYVSPRAGLSVLSCADRFSAESMNKEIKVILLPIIHDCFF